MSDVPSEIFREILLLLPAESLFRFRSVCKAWSHIIDDSSFIKEHTKNQLYNHTLLVRSETGATLYTFSLDSLNFMNGSQTIDATCIENLICRYIPRINKLFFMASCHGLILLSHSEIGVVLNPLTKECRKLPKLDADVTTLYFPCGIGYDSDSDDYKVVRIDELQTHIYSLKSDSWRKVEDCPCKIERNGVFLDGVLYWPSHRAIIALDLRTERYCQLPLPRVIRGFPLSLDLEALDGCLIFSLNNHENKTFDAWVMKDNGWSKLFSLEISVLYPFLVAYLKTKGQVLLRHYRGFVWFDIQNKIIKTFTIHGFSRISCSRICPGSLVRLNGSDTGLGIVTTRVKTKSKETRLKFCVRNGG